MLVFIMYLRNLRHFPTRKVALNPGSALDRCCNIASEVYNQALLIRFASVPRFVQMSQGSFLLYMLIYGNNYEFKQCCVYTLYQQ